jgi:uncharacterized membrane protein YqjE
MLSLLGIENLIMSDANVLLTLIASNYQLVAETIFPFTAIIICNIIIITTIRNATKNRKGLQSTKEEDAGKRKSQHLTRMLIFASFAYIAVSFPYRLFLVIITLDVYKFEETCHFVHYNLCVALFFCIWTGNFCVNFYLYCLGGGKKYREDAKQVFSELKAYFICNSL